MNEKYLYLALNILTIIFPFLFSFYPKANFSKKWKYVLPGIFITGIIFLVWDELFTQMGIWGFNARYTTGIYLFSLPLEEVLFFFCIPYACVFTFFALSYLIEKDYLSPYHKIITNILIVIMLIGGIYYFDRLYTAVTFLSLAAFLIYIKLVIKPVFISRFYFAFFFLLIPFFIVNGILTGSFIDEPVVWYNNNENMNVRLGTIPLEDTFYALLMILMSIVIADRLERKSEKI